MIQQNLREPTNGKGCSLLIPGCCPGWWVISKDRFHLFGGGVLALLSAAACCGEGDVSLVGGWLDGKLGGELQHLIKFIVIQLLIEIVVTVNNANHSKVFEIKLVPWVLLCFSFPCYIQQEVAISEINASWRCFVIACTYVARHTSISCHKMIYTRCRCWACSVTMHTTRSVRTCRGSRLHPLFRTWCLRF